jgi:hypothetical protein
VNSITRAFVSESAGCDHSSRTAFLLVAPPNRETGFNRAFAGHAFLATLPAALARNMGKFEET